MILCFSVRGTRLTNLFCTKTIINHISYITKYVYVLLVKMFKLIIIPFIHPTAQSRLILIVSCTHNEFITFTYNYIILLGCSGWYISFAIYLYQ